jgi:mannose-1-phosphate guanylyltransferase
VTRDYFEALKVLSDATATGEYRLNLMGMEPTYPSEKYGYVLSSPMEMGDGRVERVSAALTAERSETPADAVSGTSILEKVSSFKEKPDVETAKKYIEQGALWNGGIFAFKLGYVLKRSHELIDYKDYRDFFDRYGEFEKISFDYAVSEREDSIGVLRFAGTWKDLGTWNTLTEAMEYPVIGNGILNDKCENTHVINSLDVPVLCMGLKDVVVAASPEGVLVSDKGESSYIKPFVDKFDQQIMFAEKSWGNYLVIDATADSLTVKVTLHKGSKMNYHSHERRDESWNIISGTGRVIVDGTERTVKAGDIVSLPVGCRHTVYAETELQIIEVQFGKDIDVHDKIKHEL